MSLAAELCTSHWVCDKLQYKTYDIIKQGYLYTTYNNIFMLTQIELKKDFKADKNIKKWNSLWDVLRPQHSYSCTLYNN